MTNEVYQTVELELEDGTKVVIRPLPLKPLRKFMKAWNDGFSPAPVKVKKPVAQPDGSFKEEEVEEVPAITDDSVMDIYTIVNGIALSKLIEDKVSRVDQYDNPKEFLGMTEKYQEYLEDNINVPNTEKILQVCGGISLDDPKLVEAAMNLLDGK